jgi:hypothetical protein
MEGSIFWDITPCNSLKVTTHTKHGALLRKYTEHDGNNTINLKGRHMNSLEKFYIY